MKRTERIAEIQEKIDQQLNNTHAAFRVAGPKTPGGRRHAEPRTRKNCLETKLALIDQELIPEYLDFGAALIADMRPVADLETAAAQQIVKIHWQLNRITMMESSIYVAAYLDLEKIIGRPLEAMEVVRARTIAWIRDCNGPKLFDKLGRQQERLINEFCRQSEVLDRLQAARLGGDPDTFDLAECAAWRWYEEMAYLYSQLREAQEGSAKLAA